MKYIFGALAGISAGIGVSLIFKDDFIGAIIGVAVISSLATIDFIVKSHG